MAGLSNLPTRTPAPHHRTLQRRSAKAWGGGKIYSTGPAAAGVPFSTKVTPMHKISPLPRHSHNNPSPPGSSKREEAGSLRCRRTSRSAPPRWPVVAAAMETGRTTILQRWSGKMEHLHLCPGWTRAVRFTVRTTSRHLPPSPWPPASTPP